MSDEQINYLKSLTEEELRQAVLIPLLIKMGFQDVIEYHGTSEKGKDLICRYQDMLGVMRYIGVVVKRTDIHGSVGKSGNAGEVLIQIQQTFDEPYTDIFNLKEVVIDECWIITSGNLKSTAIESVQGILKKSNLNKLVRFIDQRKIRSLIDKQLPNFWHKDRFLMLILHNLRASITNVSTIARYLREKDKLNIDLVRRKTTDIELEMQLASHMLEAHYLYSISDLRINAELTNINQLIARIAKEVRPLAACLRTVPIVVEFTENRPNVMCFIDKRMIAQAVWEMIVNGLQYGDSSKPVKVSVEDKHESVNIVVTDFGIGVPSDALPKIFQPHYRAENAVKLLPSGAGLGLAVVDRVAKAHAGYVSVESCANPTAFVLTLPKERLLRGER